MGLYNTDKWIITSVETDEPIEIYNGTFMEVMDYVSRNYEDGTIDIETYDNWLNRKTQFRNSFEESIANGWIYG